MSEAALPGYAGTRGMDWWAADETLRHVASQQLSEEAVARCAAFGAYAGRTLDPLVAKAHEAANLPKLVKGSVVYSKPQLAARSALAKAVYGSGEMGLTERMTRAVLANYSGEGGITCPLAMTDGLIGLLERRGTPEQKKLLPKLRSDDPEWALTGGQYVTERQGGSNVAANETRAVALKDGAWSLKGLKWFCSNPGEAWVTTAKVGDSETVGLFLVRRRDGKGGLNGHRILRLKPIGGTRGKATVEVEYDGARAEMIGKPREGLAILVNEVLSVSRLHVAAAALGFAGRALLEAKTFAAWRSAYGKTLADIPSVRERLQSMSALHAGMTVAFYAGLDALEKDAPDAEALVPLLKTAVSRRASVLVREAQLLIGGHGILDDFSPLNRLADDALVNEIWEGTHPVLAGHAAKALRRPKVLEAFVDRASAQSGLKAGKEFVRLVDASREWDEDRRSLGDERIAEAAYALLTA